MSRQTLADGSWRFTDEQWEKAQTRMQQIRGRIESVEIDADEAWEKSMRIEQIGDEEKALHTKRDILRFDAPDMAELGRIEKRLESLSREKTELMGFFSGHWNMPNKEWNFLRNTYDDLRRDLKQAKVADRQPIRERKNAIEKVLRGDHSSEALRKAYKAAGLPDDEVAEKMGQSPGSTKRTEAQQRQAELKEAVQERMQEQYDRGDSPNRKQALKDMKGSGELRRLGYYVGASIDGKKITNPEERAYKDTHGVTVKT